MCNYYFFIYLISIWELHLFNGGQKYALYIAYYYENSFLYFKLNLKYSLIIY